MVNATLHFVPAMVVFLIWPSMQPMCGQIMHFKNCRRVVCIHVPRKTESVLVRVPCYTAAAAGIIILPVLKPKQNV